ncbi:MAG TPA: lipoyl(octanoyl) transferase LipB [Chthonomonadales bacterium]|nr:lipoyl(octanoyl) transferase LipB [Chthonomonadales bacterium]
MISERTLEVINLGSVPYLDAWQIQKDTVQRRLVGAVPDTLIFVEHSPTITMGRGGPPANLLASQEALNRLGIELVDTDRGGDITYHGPGQVVGYPILDLSRPPHKPDLHLYLRLLEETIILALKDLNIETFRMPGLTGVWAEESGGNPAKIAAIGVKCGQWITSHGFALNVCPDLAHFDLIVPCGIRDSGVTSAAALTGRNLEIDMVQALIARRFAGVFGLELLPVRPRLPAPVS